MAVDLRCDNPATGPLRRLPAYTLLEILLALALTTVILGLVAMAIHVHLRVADVSRGRVEEAQLARSLLQRIAGDLRNAIPYSSGTSSSGGVSGSIQELQVETSRRPRQDRPSAAPVAADTAQTVPLSDVRTVTYSLGMPGSVDPAQRGASSDSEGGLYRRELDRAIFTLAMQQGRTAELDQASEMLASEVQDLQFTYYDGTTTTDTWDLTQQNKLPSAVKVSIAIRRPPPKSATLELTPVEESPPVVYEMLVDLPNSQVKAASQSSSTKDTTVKDTTVKETTP